MFLSKRTPKCSQNGTKLRFLCLGAPGSQFGTHILNLKKINPKIEIFFTKVMIKILNFYIYLEKYVTYYIPEKGFLKPHKMLSSEKKHISNSKS